MTTIDELYERAVEHIAQVRVNLLSNFKKITEIFTEGLMRKAAAKAKNFVKTWLESIGT